jgi:iron complex outermembrane receptor protein
MRSKSFVAVALFAAGHALAADQDKELDAVVVTASPFDGQSDLNMAQPASVLRGERLDRKQATTLGDTLATEPGVQSSYFGPGAGRPIIRGQDGPRVRVLDGGMGTADLSTLSPDHQVTAEPITARQIEILRGPATLLYGTGAIGGVVNVSTNRIPDSRQDGVFGAAEARGASGTHERAGSFELDGGKENFAWHLDGYKRKTEDYKIPGKQVRDDPASPRGRVPNSQTDSDGFSLGGSWVGERGYLGASYQKMNSNYGIPTPEAPTIDMRQHRIDVAGDLRDPLPGFTRLRARVRHGDYKHSEIESTGEVGTVFKNNGTEQRYELTHAPLGGWTGVLGFQKDDRTVSALGEEAVIPRTDNRARDLFLVESASWRDFRFELGARGGNVKLDPESDDASRKFSLRSYSAGTVWNFQPGYALALNGAVAQRAPTIEELYSDGAHHATESFEIGDPSLSKEKSRNIDLGLRKTSGAWRGKIGAFYNKVRNYIHGAYVDSDGDGAPDRVDDTGALDPNGEFTLINLSQASARFAGLEGEVSWRPDPATGPGLRLFGDRVRGRLTHGGGDLPRMSPARIGLEGDYKYGPWTANAMALFVLRQNRVATLETTTDGYVRLDAGIEYTLKAAQHVTTKLFLRGNNLLDQDMRVATSYIKDFAPLPGRSFTAGLRANFF